jgi:sterol 3beta-glucosyltransferase
MSKPVLLVAGGTRGDVQPYMALALGLRQRGFAVTMATSARWTPWVNHFGVALVTLPSDPTDLLLTPEYRSALSLHAGVGTGLLATWRYLQAARPMMSELLMYSQRTIFTKSVVVAGLATQWVAHANLQQPQVIWGLLQPLIPTDAFASPLWPTTRIPLRWNKMSHRIMNRMLWWPWRINGGGVTGGLTQINRQPALIASSPALLPSWPDKAPHHVVTGTWQMPVSPAIPPAVQQFIDQDAPYIVATFGSPAANESTALYDTVVAAAAQLGVRLLLQVPSHVTQFVNNELLLVTHVDIPHQPIFERAVAVLHHGGAGTFAAATANGVPSIIVPRGVDQRFWAAQAERLYVAPPPLARRAVTVELLAARVHEVITNLDYRQAARTIARQMSSEQGVANAIQVLAPYTGTV